MNKRTLFTALNEERAIFIEKLKENPEQWSVDIENKYKNEYPVRINFEKRNDEINPSAMVLMQEDYGLPEYNAESVADLLFERIIFENNAVKIDVSSISKNVNDGISVANVPMIEAVLNYVPILKIYRDKVLNSSLINIYQMESALERKGYREEKLVDMKNDLQTLGRLVLIDKTNEKGETKIKDTESLIDVILSKEVRLNISKQSSLFEGMYEKLDKAMIDNNIKKEKKRKLRR